MRAWKRIAIATVGIAACASLTAPWFLRAPAPTTVVRPPPPPRTNDGTPPAPPQTSTAPPTVVVYDKILTEDIATFPDMNLSFSSFHGTYPRPPSVDEDDPESVAAYREYFANRARRSAERLVPVIYEDVSRELGLGPEKNRVLLAMLQEHFVQLGTPGYPLNANEDAIDKYWNEVGERQAADLLALLGPGGVAELTRYRRSIDVRFEVENMRDFLESADLSITESQRRRMLDAMLRPGVFVQRREYSDSEADGAVRQEVTARVEQNDRQLLFAARSLLDAAQYAKYEDYLAGGRPDVIDAESPESTRATDDSE